MAIFRSNSFLRLKSCVLPPGKLIVFSRTLVLMPICFLQAIYWPHIATQLSMQSHCSLLASYQCDWVMQNDLDEFYTTHDGSRLVDSLERQSDRTCGILLPRYLLMRYPDEILIRIPPGGVARNYLCRSETVVTLKTILRLDHAHESFANAVHFHACQPNMEMGGLRGAYFSHYDLQAWELYFLKYTRDALFGEGRQGTIRANLSVDVPEPDYLLLASACPPNPPNLTVVHALWSALSYKQLDKSQNGAPRRNLVTGTPGEESVLHLLRAASRTSDARKKQSNIPPS
eukprot:m.871382 g.871382  ORF g.871382 m.871382 type:complete len:287 (-) comp59762_c0_seq5:630-1490(-)